MGDPGSLEFLVAMGSNPCRLRTGLGRGKYLEGEIHSRPPDPARSGRPGALGMNRLGPPLAVQAGAQDQTLRSGTFAESMAWRRKAGSALLPLEYRISRGPLNWTR